MSASLSPARALPASSGSGFQYEQILDRAVGPSQQVAGGKLPHILVKALRSRQIFVVKEFMNRAEIDRQAARNGMCKDGARLRAERHNAGAHAPIQRLLAEAVARQVQATGSALEKREREHAVDFAKCPFDAVALQEAEQDFRVRAIGEIDAGGRQLRRECGIAVDLAVEDERVAGDRVCARLVAAVQIDDGQPEMSKGDRTCNMNAVFIRAAMGDGVEHPAHDAGIGVDRTRRVACKADYAAHAAPTRQSMFTVLLTRYARLSRLSK